MTGRHKACACLTRSPEACRGISSSHGSQPASAVARFWARREQDAQESMEAAIQKAADELVEKFEEQWKPAMENLQEADMAFDDLEGEPCSARGG